MKDKQTLLRWAGLLCVLTLLAPFGLNVVSATAEAPKGAAPKENIQGTEARADRITLRLSQVEKSELPPVTFFHDKHTTAMAKDKKSCDSCHGTAKDGKTLVLTFMEASESMPYAVAKDYFHSKCVSCHVQTAKTGKPSGPEASQCRSCHSGREEVKSSWREIDMDKSLHYRHIASGEIPAVEGGKTNCASCHHVFDADAKKLVWEKGAEDNCRVCHGAAPQKLPNGGTPPSFAGAAHMSCVSCHYNIGREAAGTASSGTSATPPKTGPYSCAGCHTKEAQSKIEILTQVPRLERGQPDAVLMVPTASRAEAQPKGSMRPVAFDHKRHEAAARDCRTCHHVKIDSCTSCHSLDATKKGDGINLAQAMHAKQSDRSCVGCHNTKKARPECAGCHGFVRTSMTPNSCAACHSTPEGFTDEQAQDGSLAKLSREDRVSIGKAAVSARTAPKTAVDGMMRLSDVPEFVTIGNMTDKFEPVKMPHRQILKAMAAAVGDDALANGFHRSELSLCQGCHHNSPPSKTPPSCVSCHGKTMASPDGRPGLMAAYHQQCMGCHTRMNVEKPARTDCVGCHKERAKS